MQNKPTWKIWIDTGGTFTDCIALTPQGERLRTKVLSSGRLRGRITKKESPGCFRFTQKWGVKTNIFEGYTFRSLVPNGGQATIKKLDLRRQLLVMDRELELPPMTDFELYANEEAPILAARLITETPLKTPLPPIQMRLGSTKGTNALLERKGASMALLITQGFADLIAIGTQQRPDLFQLNIPEPQPLYGNVFEVDERLVADGAILKPLHETTIENLIRQLKAVQVEAVAIALLHSYRNPVHEQLLQQQLEEAGIPFVSASHALSPSIQLLPRTQTTLVNAYLSPVIEHYLQHIRTRIERADVPSALRIMTSAGGLVDAALFSPKDSLLSGPAGGVVGAATIARQLDHPKILTLDMGGTSTDTARYDGQYDYQFTTIIDDIEMTSPALAIETVAAGGGSCCFFEKGRLQVGPESAGASPGPACYGAGGPLTITDVNLLLGKLDPSAMGIPLRLDRAREALAAVCQEVEQQTGTPHSKSELLHGFEQIANEKMAEAIRRISVAKGFDPKDYALLVFGGAGGLHGCQIARLLDIDTIILPYEAGLLSAFGIGQSRIERFAEKQILQSLATCQSALPKIVDELATIAEAEIGKEGLTLEEIERTAVQVFLRFKGQNSTLEIPYESSDQLADQFEKQYRDLFGHFPDRLPIEVESIKVFVAARQEHLPNIPSEEKVHAATLSDSLTSPVGNESIPIYDWDQLAKGAQFTGPAILRNAFATSFIEAGWEVIITGGDKHAIGYWRGITKKSDENLKTAVELELFTNRFSAIAEEMGAQLQRTAFSVNIKERLDFSCAILDADGELLVNAPHIPVHLGSLGICARLVKERLPIRPGDVVITNHPKYGGSHLPDLTMLSGVFTDDEQLIGYVINRAHHAEIGGKRPGSMPPDAINLAEEGVSFVPTYLVARGTIRWEKIRKHLAGAPYPSRMIEENLADLNAALASLRSGEQALQKLVQNHGIQKVQYYMQQLKATAHQALVKALKPYRHQTFKAIEALDSGHQIKARIAIKEDRVLFDFTGTDAVHPFNLNANISIVYSAIIYVLRLLCAGSIPLNEGLMQSVDVQLPVDSFLHPHFDDDPEKCPAVVGGNTEVSQRLVDTLLKALGLAACSQGTMNNFLFGNHRFGYYETIGGGVGAGPGFDGRSAVHQHMTNTRITDPEDLEFRFPVRLHRFAIRRGSGGQGAYKGGDGIIREVEFLEPMEVTLLTQHRKEAPYGLEGGDAGQKGQQTLLQKGGAEILLQGVDSTSVTQGDRIRIETPGGGGFGKSRKAEK